MDTKYPDLSIEKSHPKAALYHTSSQEDHFCPTEEKRLCPTTQIVDVGQLDPSIFECLQLSFEGAYQHLHHEYYNTICIFPT